jgi:hypothetical protein
MLIAFSPMTIKIIAIAFLLSLMPIVAAQDTTEQGFVITLKNGSTIRGRTLSRDETTGKLRLTMTETSASQPKSYAIVAMDDAEAIRAPVADTDSIRIRLRGGSELRCREFSLGADTITVKLGTASRVDVPWEEIESITFGP